MASNSSKGTSEGLDFQARQNASREICRILSGLGLSLSESEDIFTLFWKFRNCLGASTKYRYVQKLVPITIYLHFNLHCKGISEQELLAISNITPQEFSSFKAQLREYIPRYYS